MTDGQCKLRYAIVGAGMAGILAGVQLQAKGEDFTIFEKAGRIGGTWRENRYPGLTCDVPAHAYTYSFEPYAEWQAYYGTGDEIQAYFEMVVDKYRIRNRIRFNSEVAALEWSDDRGTWQVSLADGSSEEFDVVIAASGVLHHPKMPEIEGLDLFEGPAFHTARWDEGAAIEGARVGLIGSGSTGVQIVTAINKKVEKLVHFQRSPQWIMPVPYFTYSDEERQAFRENPALMDDIRYSDEYLGSVRRFTDAVKDFDSKEIKEIEKICSDHFEASIADPVLKEKLRPNYRAACKRLIYSWSYYEEVQHPAVFVETGKILRVESKGVRMADGTFHELDTLVLATGFQADRFIRPAKVTGQQGIKLDDFWSRRPTAFNSVTLPGFPNFFMLNGPTGPVGNFSLIDIAERQWGYIDQLIEVLRTGQARAVAPRIEAHEDYEERRIAAAKRTIFGSGCQSWYLDGEGVPASWPWSYDDFAKLMSKPGLEDFQIQRIPADA